MKITRKQLRKLINETIYVNPQGDAFDTFRDPAKPHTRALSKIDFLKSQSNEKIRGFAPDKKDLNLDDDHQMALIDQGIQLADIVGDQGEFPQFSKDELALRDYATGEVSRAYNALEFDGTYKDNTPLQKGNPYYGGGTDYNSHVDQLEHQMNVEIKKLLKKTDYPAYWDVIGTLQNIPSYDRLMKIVSDKQGDFSPTMKRLKDLPERVANQHGVHY